MHAGIPGKHEGTHGAHKLPQATDRHMGPMMKGSGETKSHTAIGNGITSTNSTRLGGGAHKSSGEGFCKAKK